MCKLLILRFVEAQNASDGDIVSSTAETSSATQAEYINAKRSALRTPSFDREYMTIVLFCRSRLSRRAIQRELVQVKNIKDYLKLFILFIFYIQNP